MVTVVMREKGKFDQILVFDLVVWLRDSICRKGRYVSRW